MTKIFTRRLRIILVPFCHGKLNTSNYRRKLRGLSYDSDSSNLCFSLCCREDGCRRRVKVRSIRFIGRSPYNIVWRLLIIYLAHNQQHALIALAIKFDLDLSTVKRWQQWWKELTRNSHWKQYSPYFFISHFQLPSSLFDVWQDQSAARTVEQILLVLSELFEHRP